MLVVSGLFFYPIKSCRGIRLASARLDERGIHHDRRWMIVDRDGLFVTQRKHPGLARIFVRVTQQELHIHVAGEPRKCISVPRSIWEGPSRIPVTVWKHNGLGIDQGEEAARFFSTHLAKPVRLVRMPKDHIRAPNRRPDGVTTQVGFADGYPLLLTSERSLAYLSQHLPEGYAPLPMDRFRPNIVVAGAKEPWEEERWRELRIDGVRFHGVKPCERCPITQTDQQTGQRPSKEPLATLARIHRDGNAALFGANLIHEGLGTIRVGSRLEDIVFGDRPGL